MSVEKPRGKSPVYYDDDTLERMKRYYKIEQYDELPTIHKDSRTTESK